MSGVSWLANRFRACTTSNSSPMAPPVLKSSSIAARNCWRCSAISLSNAESPGSKSPRRVGAVELVEPLAGQLGEPLERPVKRLQAALDLVEPVGPKIDRPAIVARARAARGAYPANGP